MRFDPLALDAAGFDALVHELRFRFHKWDTYLAGSLRVMPDALLLSEAEHDDAVACCLQVNAALARVAAWVRREPDCFERLAIPKAVRPLIEAEIEWPFQIARYDLIPTAEGWMIPEFNEDAPGGFNESVAGNALFAKALARGRVPGDFGQSFLDGVPAGRRCGLIYATGYAEDLQHMLVLADLLRSRGVEAILGSPEQLTCGPLGRPRLQGESIDWILRFFPGEWYRFLADLRAWRRAVARIPVVNPLSRLLRQSKGLYAWWRHAPAVDVADREVLDRYTPYTAFFRVDMIPMLKAERERWVLKQSFGRMGDAVVIGRRSSPGDWDRALAEAAKQPANWIAQHAFTPLSLPTARGVAQYPALGVYLVNGAFAGYYSRADEAGFTTHEAHYVVTAVENP
ncbi:MAG TPA: glutathionylspermidine synthase family protein [Xanthomonadaceae bacterium]|nr:glutathionylspermidine synthase family protein [Xanthomonadaceae bacterium]